MKTSRGQAVDKPWISHGQAVDKSLLLDNNAVYMSVVAGPLATRCTSTSFKCVWSLVWSGGNGAQVDN